MMTLQRSCRHADRSSVALRHECCHLLGRALISCSVRRVKLLRRRASSTARHCIVEPHAKRPCLRSISTARPPQHRRLPLLLPITHHRPTSRPHSPRLPLLLPRHPLRPLLPHPPPPPTWTPVSTCRSETLNPSGCTRSGRSSSNNNLHHHTTTRRPRLS